MKNTRNLALKALPDRAFTKIISSLTNRRIPKIARKTLFSAFAKLTNAELSEAEAELSSYKTWDAFFTRKLKPNARSIDSCALTSPCDGKIAAIGRIREGKLLQVKGLTYSIDELLHIDTPNEWENAHYLTIYLSPANYHRVHAPKKINISQIRHIGGKLLPVNPWSASVVENLFSQNERVIFSFDKGALVMVGATGVSGISVTNGPILSKKHHFTHQENHRYSPPLTYQQGQELGIFHLGSTVVLIWIGTPPNEKLTIGQPISMGNALLSPKL